MAGAVATSPRAIGTVAVGRGCTTGTRGTSTATGAGAAQTRVEVESKPADASWILNEKPKDRCRTRR